ncbi:uncharacterized protein BKA78DRAFT_118889 [Phyllosticta capitalensis]|uniref:uncharacterized protein n=1 Tax=Phyllosticta capitalensis TaxID=121624 RepID=UPI0031305A53
MVTTAVVSKKSERGCWRHSYRKSGRRWTAAAQGLQGCSLQTLSVKICRTLDLRVLSAARVVAWQAGSEVVSLPGGDLLGRPRHERHCPSQTALAAWTKQGPTLHCLCHCRPLLVVAILPWDAPVSRSASSKKPGPRPRVSPLVHFLLPLLPLQTPPLS